MPIEIKIPAVGESIRVSIDESFRRLEAVRSRIWRAECHYRHAETLSRGRFSRSNEQSFAPGMNAIEVALFIRQRCA